MIVREYDASRDRDALWRCVVELQDFERVIDARMPVGASIAERYLREMAEDCAKYAGQILVADDEGHVVGYAAVWARARCDDISDAPREYALVQDLVVLTSHRKRGIGRALLEASTDYAKARGATCLRIAVLAENPGARALYQSYGFREREILLEMSLPPE